MINVLIQALTVLSGLLVNFVVPGLYGLESYGLFIQSNILVFVFQKLTDIVNEPLISHVEGRHIFATSLLLASVVLLLFLIVDYLDPIGNPFLLGAMLVSSCSLLAMYAQRQQLRVLSYLVCFLVTFGILLGLKMLAGWNLSIVDVLILTNIIPGSFACVGLVATGSRLPSGNLLKSTIHNLISLLPKMLSVTLVFNLLTNILPYILSKTLPVRDLGLFRVLTSIIQSATSLFPINTKAIFVAFVAGERREALFKIIMSTSLLYFAVVGLSGYLLTLIVPKLSTYLVLVSSLPALYWCVVFERYLLASGMNRQVLVSNLVVGVAAISAVFFVKELSHAVLYYAIWISVYAIALMVHCPINRNRGITALTLALSPLVVWLQNISMLYAVTYLFALPIIAISIFSFKMANLRELRF